jgi:hypothetical protein
LINSSAGIENFYYVSLLDTGIVEGVAYGVAIPTPFLTTNTQRSAMVGSWLIRDEVVPEPASYTTCGIVILCLIIRRRSKA